MIKKITVLLMILSVTASFSFAGGWDSKKGMDKINLDGELVCIGCSLKKLDGANAQCNIYAHHAIGFKMKDGTLWSIVDNAKGHDIIRAHSLLEHKKATISGWIFPLAHYIELDAINVQGVSKGQIQKAGHEEDMILSKKLGSRKIGQAPESGHTH